MLPNLNILLAACGYSQDGMDDLMLLQLTPSGKLRFVSGCARGDDPSFLLWHNQTLYVACEQQNTAKMAAYRLGEGRRTLEKKWEWQLPHGGLCHLEHNGGLLYGSCRADGTFFAADPLRGTRLWTYRNEQAPQPHAHWMAFGQNDNMYAADLGADAVYAFKMQQGRPAEQPYATFKTAPGAGPRQAIEHGGYVYVVNELASNICVYTQSGELLQCCPATAAPKSNHCANIAINGSKMYVANRGANSVACLEIEKNGRLTPTWESPLGKSWPRYVLPIGQTHLLVACQNSDQLACYTLCEGGMWFCSALELPAAACVRQLGFD